MHTTLNAKVQRLLERAIADGRHRGLQAGPRHLQPQNSQSGSAAWADPDVGLVVAVTVNKLQAAMLGSGIAFDVGGLIREELGLQ